MSNIDKNLKKILSSRYGKDVRQAIHDSIQECYQDGKTAGTYLQSFSNTVTTTTSEGKGVLTSLTPNVEGAEGIGTVTYIDTTDASGNTNRATIYHNGLYKIGDVADSIEVVDGKYKLCRRFGVIDLGSLTWTYESNHNRFYATSSLVSSVARSINLYTDDYECKHNGESINDSWDMVIYNGTPNTIIIHNHTYTDATELKSALSGKYALYTLSATIYEDLDQESFYTIKTYADSTTISVADCNVELRVPTSEDGAIILDAYINDKLVELTKLANTVVSDAWQSTKSYAVGEYCLKDDTLYKCTVANVGQTPPNTSYWSATSICAELLALANKLS